MEKSIQTVPYFPVAHRILKWDTNPSEEPLNPKIRAYTYAMTIAQGETSYAVENQSKLPLTLLNLKKGVEFMDGVSDNDHKILARNRLCKKIDSLVFNIMLNACPAENTVERMDLHPDAVSEAMCRIETQGCIPSNIIIHPARYKDFRAWGKNYFEEATRRDILLSGLYGYLWMCDIRVSLMMPKDKILVTGMDQFVGTLQQKEIVGNEDSIKDECVGEYEYPIICGFPAKNFTYIKTDKQWMAETNINVLLRNPSLIAQVILK